MAHFMTVVPPAMKAALLWSGGMAVNFGVLWMSEHNPHLSSLILCCTIWQIGRKLSLRPIAVLKPQFYTGSNSPVLAGFFAGTAAPAFSVLDFRFALCRQCYRSHRARSDTVLAGSAPVLKNYIPLQQHCCSCSLSSKITSALPLSV